jgi:uracil-DNA glycosylase
MELDVQVPSHWPAGAKILFVDEAPGKDDVDAKRGFVGSGGRLIQRACTVAGIPWESCGHAYIVKRGLGSGKKFEEELYETIEEPIYTPTGKLSKRKQKTTLWTAEMEEWIDRSAAEFREFNPNLIVASGYETLCAITAISRVADYRGSVVESRGSFARPDGNSFKVLATQRPSKIVTGSVGDFWILAHDLKKAKREAEFAEIRREGYAETIAPTLAQCIAALRDIATLQLPWTLDVETRAGTLACFAVATRYPEGIGSTCIPIQTPTGPYWKPEEELQIWEVMRETASSNPYFCNQNVEYDIYYLLRYGVEPSGVWMDTMLAHSILYPEFPKGLDFLCSFYLDDVVYYKGEGRSWSDGDRDEELWQYNIKDAVFTLRVMEKIDEELRKRGWHEAYHGSASMLRV